MPDQSANDKTAAACASGTPPVKPPPKRKLSPATSILYNKMAHGAKLKERSKSVPSIVTAGLSDSPNDEVDGAKVFRKQLQTLVGKTRKRRNGTHEMSPPGARSPSPRTQKRSSKMFSVGPPQVTLQREPCMEEEFHLKVKELAIHNRQLKERLKAERERAQQAELILKQEKEEHIAMVMNVIDSHQSRAEKLNKRLKDLSRTAEILHHEKGKLERVLTETKETHHKDTQKHQARTEMLEEIVKSAKTEREAMDKQITHLMEEVSQLERDKALLTQDVSSLRKSENELSQEVRDLRSAKKHLLEKVSGLTGENSRLTEEVCNLTLEKTQLQADLDKSSTEVSRLKQELSSCDTKNDHYDVLLDMALNRVKLLESSKESVSRSQSAMSHHSNRSDADSLLSLQNSATPPHISVTTERGSAASSPQISVRSLDGVSKPRADSHDSDRGMKAINSLCASLSSLAGNLERERNNNNDTEKYDSLSGDCYQGDLLWASSPSLLDVAECDGSRHLKSSQSTPDLLMLGDGVDLHDSVSSYDGSSFLSTENATKGGMKSASSSWESIDILEQDSTDRGPPQIVVTPLKVESSSESSSSSLATNKKKSRLSLKKLFQGFTIDEDSPGTKRKRAPKLKDTKRSLTDVRSFDEGSIPSSLRSQAVTGGISSIDSLEARRRNLICAPEDYDEYMKSTARKKHSYKDVFKFLGGLGSSEKSSKRKLSSTKRRHSKY